MSDSDTGIVEIRGNQYKTVALRVSEFREQHPDWCIDTSIIEWTNKVVVIRAEVRDPAGNLIGAGHAEEIRSEGPINRTAAVENCETSAVGRALAACGYAGSEYASVNEIEAARKRQSEGRTMDQVAAREPGDRPLRRNVEGPVESVERHETDSGAVYWMVRVGGDRGAVAGTQKQDDAEFFEAAREDGSEVKATVEKTEKGTYRIVSFSLANETEMESESK